MLKQLSILEVKKGDRSYQFHLSSDSPLGEVHDVLIEMRAYIVDIIKAHVPKAETPTEEVKDAVS